MPAVIYFEKELPDLGGSMRVTEDLEDIAALIEYAKTINKRFIIVHQKRPEGDPVQHGIRVSLIGAVR